MVDCDMPTDSESELQLEIVHVLFMDVVGYSKLLLDEQRERLQTLNEIVRSTAQFRASDAKGMLVRIPTGDGMALIFRDAVEAPLRCAVEISEAIKTHPEIHLRTGIHSGPVSEVTDVNERTNIAGAGIDIAQRVMDCGDAGHILLSRHVADDLAPHPRWNRYLHDLGECEVKHGGKVFLVNFYTDKVGNPQPPKKLDRALRGRSSLAVASRSAPTFRRKYLLIAAAALLIAVIGIGLSIYSRKATVTRLLPEKSIAVLPLLNESGDPRDEYFSDGLSEELIAALAQNRELKVIGRSSSFRFKERKEDSKTIGEKLGVSTLLEGTVRKQGDKVRIVAELVNAADGIELWTRTFDRELKDIFAVQEEIARAVADSLKVTLLGSSDRSAQRAAPNSVEAHNAYLQGHFHFQRRNVEDYRKAVGYFDQAIQLDPDYALAYAERSEASTLIGDLTGQRTTAWPKAQSDAEKAVAIAPALAEAHAALGWVRFFVDWKFTEGLSELTRAKELSPGNPTANDLLARVIVYLGRLDEAERQARQAVDLDPLAFLAQNNLARVLFLAGKLDEANAIGRKSAELQPAAASSHRWQALVAVQRRDGEAALREAQQEPDEGYRRFELALAQYVRGDRKTADTALAELIANGRDQLAYQIAEVYAVRGEPDKAFEWLQISFDNHDSGTLSLLVDPLLRGLRDDPRYKNLLAKLGLPAPS
jgi:TolB-like protein/class 3 adenylate cyclase/Flp pilus assembly protein TadD